MSDPIHKSGQPSPDGYERSDLGVAGVLYFLAGLTAMVLLAYFAMGGLYAFLDRREKAQQPELNPLITNAPADTRKETKEDTLKFASPRLEDDERSQLNDILRSQDETLYSYGWVDEKAGVVRIPIERAMEIVAQRGLPVRSQPGTADAAAQERAKNDDPGEAGPAKTSAKTTGAKKGGKP
jgi:hypothetical protein